MTAKPTPETQQLKRTPRPDLHQEHLLMALDRAADDLEAHVPQAQVWRDLSRAFMNLGVVDYELGPRRWRVLKSQSGRRVIDLPVALR